MVTPKLHEAWTDPNRGKDRATLRPRAGTGQLPRWWVGNLIRRFSLQLLDIDKVLCAASPRGACLQRPPRSRYYPKVHKLPAFVLSAAVLALSGWILEPVNCLAGDPHFRPAGKGARIGALGKDYVVLPRVYTEVNKLWGGSAYALPAGIYRVKFEDDEGYYLPAPNKLAGKISTEYYEQEGGLFIRKDKPADVYIYVVNPKTGEPVPPDKSGPPLGRRFTAQLRQ